MDVGLYQYKISIYIYLESKTNFKTGKNSKIVKVNMYVSEKI